MIEEWVAKSWMFIYCLGLFLGFGTALDLVEQANELGKEYTTKWDMFKWWLDPRKKSRDTHEKRSTN